LKIKIAYLCSSYPAVSHTFILREIEALRRLGAAITTFSIHRTDPDQLLAAAEREAFESTVTILPPRWSRLFSAHLRLAIGNPSAYLSTLALAWSLAPVGPRGRLWQIFYFGESVVLWDECRRRDLRHIHVHLANVAADVALLASQIGSAVEPERPWSWSFTMHGPTEFFDVRHFRLAEKVRYARFVVCISDYARSQLMALSDPETWEKLHVIHVGLPIEQFTRLGDEPPLRSDAEILCIGRLVPEKGQAVLLRAVATLIERGHAVKLTIAGAGQDKSSLELHAKRLGIASRVSFPGAVGQDQIRGLYEEASIFCLPSFAEGIPVVLMEAMAMRIAVVGTRITGIPELIEDGETGLLVAPGCDDQLSHSLERLLVDRQLRHRLGDRAREKVISDFNAENSAGQLHALFAAQLLRAAPLRPRVPAIANEGV
jgi:colanic acid/amylovoran biosynthesis glycosyltransferase